MEYVMQGGGVNVEVRVCVGLRPAFLAVSVLELAFRSWCCGG